MPLRSTSLDLPVESFDVILTWYLLTTLVCLAFTPLVLVLCRNLAFIYFEEEGRREVLRGIDERLVAGGYLVLGAHESLPGGVPDLVSCRTRPELWQKRADA